MIELVIFDMAGTTVKDDRYVDAVLSEVLFEHNTQLKQKDLDHIMGWPKPMAIKYLLEAGYTGSRSINDTFIDELHNLFVHKMIAFYEESELVQEIEGATDTFMEIKLHGAKVAFDTGFSRSIADVIINRLGWNDGLLDATITSDEVINGRPEPDMIFKLMSHLGVNDPKNVVKVGDTQSDILQGQKANCGKVIGVASGTYTKTELLTYNPDTVLNSIIELPSFLWN